jgi:cell division cycle 14
LASPQDSIGKPIAKSDPRYASIPTTPEDIANCKSLNTPFKNVLSYFTQRNVGLVVRLNDPLYSPTFFTANGIQHLDMIFDDGTCPTMKMVRQFITLSREMIEVKKKGIAVHCKAGLGRTGCLIGAYLIYKHAFTANEVIAYMRFMRPGMVVGPQQHWLHINQHTFREWHYEDQMREKMASALAPATPVRPSIKSRAQTTTAAGTPPHGTKRPALEEITSNEKSPGGSHCDDSFLPAPTPGQPRKTSKAYGRNGAKRIASMGEENEPFILPDAEIVSFERHVTHQEGTESGEEVQIHMMMRTGSRSPKSPVGAKARRVVSASASVSGVRKTSGRVGSLGVVSKNGIILEGKVK